MVDLIEDLLAECEEEFGRHEADWWRRQYEAVYWDEDQVRDLAERLLIMFEDWEV